MVAALSKVLTDATARSPRDRPSANEMFATLEKAQTIASGGIAREQTACGDYALLKEIEHRVKEVSDATITHLINPDHGACSFVCTDSTATTSGTVRCGRAFLGLAQDGDAVDGGTCIQRHAVC